MEHTILVVDDEKQIVKIVKMYLAQAGYRVATAYDGHSALTLFRHEQPDLVVLDLNLPEIDGLDVCRAIRGESKTPVIMLTARAEEADKLIGLELGADDYIVKRFSPREVVARVRTVLRRVTGEVALPNLLRADELTLNLDSHTLQRGKQPIELTPTEFDLLKTLMQNRGRALSRSQLLDRALGDSFEGYERTSEFRWYVTRSRQQWATRLAPLAADCFACNERWDGVEQVQLSGWIAFGQRTLREGQCQRGRVAARQRSAVPPLRGEARHRLPQAGTCERATPMCQRDQVKRVGANQAQERSDR